MTFCNGTWTGLKRQCNRSLLLALLSDISSFSLGLIPVGKQLMMTLFQEKSLTDR